MLFLYFVHHLRTLLVEERLDQRSENKTKGASALSAAFMVCRRGAWGFKAAGALCRVKGMCTGLRQRSGGADGRVRVKQPHTESTGDWGGRSTRRTGGDGWQEGVALRGRDGGINGGGGNYLSGESALKRYSGRIVRRHTEQDTVESSQPSQRDQMILTEEKV